jgi:hypothetical protein
MVRSCLVAKAAAELCARSGMPPRLDGWLGWRASAWAPATGRVQAERDDAGFGVAAAERNHSVYFGVLRCSKENAKKELHFALPAL